MDVWSAGRLQGRAEKALWDRVREKSLEWANIGAPDPTSGSCWGPERTIRASIIKEIALGEAPVDPCIIRIRGARITEELNLEAARAVCPLDFEGCYFDHEINLEQLEAPAIYMQKCNIPGGIRADQLHTHHNFYLNGSSIGAPLLLRSAKIDGQLAMKNAKLGPGAPLRAGSITISQGAYFQAIKVEDKVHLAGARITAKFDMRGATLTKSQDGRALHAPRIQVSGNVLLSNDFRAEGTVDFTNATVTGDVRCSGGTFVKPAFGETRERCLDLARARIQQHVYLNNGFNATGTVHLADATIEGTLDCEGGRFENPSDTAIYAPGIQVGRDVRLTKALTPAATDESGFSVRGEVVLGGACINARLDCRGGHFLTDGAGQRSITARAMTVGSLKFGCGFLAQGTVDLRRTTVTGELVDITSIETQNIKMTRLTYKTLRESKESGESGPKKLIAWLKKVDYSPQIFRQLSSAYAAEGEEGWAKKALVAGRDARRMKTLGYGPRRGAEFLLKLLVGYGYSPFRVLYYLIGLEFFGGIWFSIREHAMEVSPLYQRTQSQGTPWHPDFNPWIYTGDLLLPVVDLQQSKYWIPTHSEEWISVALTISGWALATALVAGLGSVFRSDARKDSELIK
ncbi:hypothetical protein AB0K09_06950 [Streptomyces sp. NPDC049577]|uniref:hypothetical protein n=1 Tax=Streptomyces sp. NPDC049577 TaxID=3155153 RepID=UPI003412CC3D